MFAGVGPSCRSFCNAWPSIFSKNMTEAKNCMKSYAILIFALLVNSILQVVLPFVPKNTFFIVFF